MRREWGGSSFGLYFIGCFIAEACCLDVVLRAERYVEVGGHVVLKCDYAISPDQLHKVEWFHGQKKIYQYVKGRKPPHRNYTFPGAVIDMGHSDDHQVMLKDVNFEASGYYSCEVSTNTPIYTKPSDPHELTVMQSQMADPTIRFWKSTYTVGETLQVNCTSGPARPTPDITWFINQVQAGEDQIRIFLVESEPNSLTVQLTLTVEEEHLKGLELVCLSTIPAYLGHHVRHSHYADHRSTFVKIEVIAYIPEPVPSSSLAVPVLPAMLLPLICQKIVLIRIV